MKLQSLNLNYFKGIKHYNLVLNSQDCQIYGDNGTGKSSLMDAWCYLLFGKDSLNQTDFQIKTLDESGVPYPMIDHEVEAVIELDGKTMTLKKVYKELWTKRRGSSKEEFTGHETEHFIDSVPTTKRDYEARIASIIPEKTFRILTNPRAFNVDLSWQERRKILLEVCGDISDKDVIASDAKLASLPGILGPHSLDDYRKIITTNKVKINKELESIPTRIDEVMRGLPAIDHIDAVYVATNIDALTQKKEAKVNERTLVENGGGVIEKKKQLEQVKLDIQTLENAHFKTRSDASQVVKTQLDATVREADKIRRDIENKEQSISIGKSGAAELDVEMDVLRNRWNLIDRREFIFEENNTCPTCNQPLPAEQVTAAREKALALFNHNKAEDSKTIIHNGTEAKSRKEALLTSSGKLAAEVEILRAKLPALEKQASELNAKLSRHDDTKPEGVDALVTKKAQLEAEIAESGNGNSSQLAALKSEIEALDKEITAAQESLSLLKQRESGEKRIAELETQEKKLAGEFETLESQLFLCESFIKRKVSMLTDRINNKFQMARFKLFEQLINGGIQEVCECTVNGVPYSSLNNSAQINVGLDICNTLSDHYGITVPTWIDNSEAVVQLLPTKGQQIRLYVSGTDRELRIAKGE